MAAAHQRAAAPSLADLAREALTANGGKVEPAARALTAQLAADRRLLGAVLERVVADAVAYRTQAAVRSERASIIRHATDTHVAVACRHTIREGFSA